MLIHGKRSTYINHGCHCDLCRKANHEYNVKRKSERWIAIRLYPNSAVHGIVSTYQNWGCRCNPCSEANTVSHRNWRKAKASK